MKKVFLIVTALMMSVSAKTQNLNAANGGYESTRIIDGQKFRVQYYEYEIEKSLDEVWAEVSGNFVNVGQIASSINDSHCESGDLTEGLGAARFCSLAFAGKTIEIKERITEFTETENHKEYTYDVYETKGFPAKVYNTWLVRKGTDGKIYLGNIFIFRAKPAFMTGMMGKKSTKLKAQINSVLAYKHYLETGKKKADPVVFDKLFQSLFSNQLA